MSEVCSKEPDSYKNEINNIFIRDSNDRNINKLKGVDNSMHIIHNEQMKSKVQSNANEESNVNKLQKDESKINQESIINHINGTELATQTKNFNLIQIFPHKKETKAQNLIENIKKMINAFNIRPKRKLTPEIFFAKDIINKKSNPVEKNKEKNDGKYDESRKQSKKINSISNLKNYDGTIFKEPIDIKTNIHDASKINEKVIEKKILERKNIKEIIENIKQLINNQILIKKIVKKEYFVPTDFQIMEGKEASKLPFIINLNNYINILNCIFVYANNDILFFHKLLSLIGAKFTYCERGEKDIIDFGLLTNISYNIFPYIISRGETGFNDPELSKLSGEYCDIVKNKKLDLSYLFEESNRGYILTEIDENNYIEYPVILYYLNSQAVKKLYNDGIFNSPKDYVLEDKKLDGNPLSGYNEHDICFRAKNDIKISQNNQFNIVKLPNEDIVDEFNFEIKKYVEFKKDTVYIIEVKRNIDELIKNNTLNKIIERTNTFIESIRNIIYDKLNKENIQNYELLFICNKNRKKAVKTIMDNNINNKVIFSNTTISLNTISSLNRNIYELHVKTDSLKEAKVYNEKQITNLKEGIKELEKKMNNKDEQIKGLEEKMNNKDKIHEEEINTLKKEMEILSKNLNSLDEKSNSYDTNYVRFLNILDKMIISAQYVSLNLKEILSKKSEQVKNRIEAIATAYDECALEYFKDSNDPTFLSGLIIGNLEEESNAEECQKILDYLDNKIKNGHFKNYFKALKDMVFGKDVKRLEKTMKIALKYDKIDIINKLVLYILLLEKEYSKKFIEYKFACSILYYLIDYYSVEDFVIIINKDCDKIGFIFEKLISFINNDNLLQYRKQMAK